MRKRSLILGFSLIIAMLIAAKLLLPPPFATGTEVVLPNIEGEINKLVTEKHIPSLHIGVISGGELNWVRAFGEQTSPDTVFLIGSVQKVLVAISILQLHEKGKIDLNSDVNDYLSFDLRNPTFPNSSITIRMLLSHRSGLNQLLPCEFCYDWDGLYYPEYYEHGYFPPIIGISLAEYLNECLDPNGSYYSDRNWLFNPGTQYSYSNSGYKILMHLLETVSNQSIQEYMQENIFKPLNMNNTGFNASSYIGHHAIPHTRTHGQDTELPVWNGQYMMRSTVTDLGHLLIALMNQGQYNDYQLLQQDTLNMMFEKATSYINDTYLKKQIRSEGYGLGIDIFSHQILGHGGSTVGFTAQIYLNPNTRTGLIRLSNVNAILDPESQDFQPILQTTTQIQNLILTNTGLLPPIDFDDTPPLILTIITTIIVGNIFQGIKNRQTKTNTKKHKREENWERGMDLNHRS